MLGQQQLGSNDLAISLTNLVGYIEENLSKVSTRMMNVQVRLVQKLSENQKIIEVVTKHDNSAPSFSQESIGT